MKRLIVIGLALLFAVPAIADYRTDRAELMASAGLFNVAALDNPAYAEQADGMAKDSSRGRVSIQGKIGSGKMEESVNLQYEGLVDHSRLSQVRFTGTAEDRDGIIFTFYYNNGSLIKTTSLGSQHGGNRMTTYTGTAGLNAYFSRRP